MEKFLIPAVIGSISAIIVALISQYFIVLKHRREVSEKYRSMYFEKKLEAYQNLWAMLGPTSKSRTIEGIYVESNGEVSLNRSLSISFINAINDYFFSMHGLFLTRNSRKHIFILRDFIEEKLIQGDDNTKLIKLTKEERKKLITAIQNLYEVLRDDVSLIDFRDRSPL